MTWAEYDLTTLLGLSQDCDQTLNLIRRLSRVYFTEVLGFRIMGNHFHPLVKMPPEEGFTDKDFNDSKTVGTKELVGRLFERLKSYFQSREKRPRGILGMDGIFSRKRPSEDIG